MFNLRIADIGLTMSIDDFMDELKDFSNNHYSQAMDLSYKPMKTRNGNHMYKITIDNQDNSYMDIVAEQDPVTGDATFKPMKLANMNSSFYEIHYDSYDICGDPEDPSIFFTEAMTNICEKHKGTFGYIDAAGRIALVKEGYNQRDVTVALVDGDGNVFSCMGAKTIKGATDNFSFSIDKPIGEWLDENLEVKTAILKLPLTEKMDYIGKWLIQARLKEEIDADEFMDIFRQAGVFGFSDASVINIYKLIM